jgi:hypothetical protein
MERPLPFPTAKETNMYNIKTLVAAATMAVAMAAGVAGADAAPWDQRDHRPVVRHDPYFNREHRPIVVRERVFDTLRLHHYRASGAPIFVHGHYVVKSFNRFGRAVFVEVDPYTGAFIGEIRI